MKDLLAVYRAKLGQAETIATPGVRKHRIDDVLHTLRRDKAIPHLTLCAFLQDHARLIKENSL